MIGKGLSSIQTARSQELLGERGPKDRHAVRFGDMAGMMGDALKVAKKTAIEEARRAAALSFGVTTFSVADVLVPNTRTQSNPLTILSESVAGYEEGGIAATFQGYFDNTHVSRSFGSISLWINGTRVARALIGAKISDPAEGISSMLPFSLPAALISAGSATSIEVRAFAFDFDNPSVATAGFYIRQAVLVITGAR